MKNMKKLLFTLSMTFVLSACGSVSKFEWKNVKNSGDGINLRSNKVKNCSLTFDNDSFKEAMKKADEAAVNKSNVYTFTGETNKVFEKLESLREKVTVSSAIYSAEGSEEAKATYDKLYDYYLSFYTWYYTFLVHVNESSPDIRNALFEGMSDVEITDFIRGFFFNDETKKLNQEIEDIENKQEEMYNQFVKDFRNQTIRVGDSGWNKYLNDSLNNFRDIMDKGGKYAAYYGYDNYLDYVYENYYNRDYHSDFVDEYSALVEKYVVPATQYYLNNVDSSITKKTAKKKIYENYTSGNIANETYFWGDLVDSYVEMMGGDMLNSYNHLKGDSYYVFSNNPDSLGTAYVSSAMAEPLIFFSSDYQHATTFIHEFGHYNAAYTNPNNSTFPFDIEETHSQGNEMLFNRYLSEYYKDDENLDIYKYIQDDQVYTMLDTAVLPTAVAKVENYIFQNLEKTNAEILSGVNTIMSKYRSYYGSGYDMILAYWAAPVVSATGYYISYSTSAVASVAIYIQAKQDYEAAKANYKKFVAYPEEQHNVDKFFTYAGLYSPVQEDTFKLFTHDNLYSF